MPKLPWFQFWVDDWCGDTELSLCAPATRAVWIDLICAMHKSGQSGELSGTAEQLARIARCRPDEFVSAADDLRVTGAADISCDGGVFVIVCRRMRREATGFVVTSKRAWIRRNYDRLVGLLKRRDGDGCMQCDAKEGLQIDHKMPLSKGGGNDTSNLQLLCGQCNRTKGASYAP